MLTTNYDLNNHNDKKKDIKVFLDVSLWTLTDADGGASRPAVILLTDSHRNPDETKSGVTLIDDAASVVVILADDLTVHNGIRGAAVPGCQ